MMPLWAHNHYHPPMKFRPLNSPLLMRSDILVVAMGLVLEQIHQPLWENCLNADAGQSNYAGRKDVMF
jgi:hypothetical protein